MPAGPNAYNSLWQVRTDAWSALEESTAHLSLLDGIAARYRAPFFSALRSYSHRPTGVFHALPVSHGKSIVNSHWIRDMVDFYGLEIFLAETSATCGGLDSLLEPTGPLREAQQLAARTFGSRQTYFVTNGTSTANKIVVQVLVQPGDIVLVDRNCHQSHHYGLMLPDPARARVRVYSTQSTHKTLTSLRQGSMIHVFSPQILAFMRSLDTPEVHGYRADLGYRVYVDKALEIAATTRPALPPDPADATPSTPPDAP